MIGLFLVILVVITLLLMFNKRTREFVKHNKELVLAIFYTIMSICFCYIFLNPNRLKFIFKSIKDKPIYLIYLLVYIAIPAYYIYISIKSYIDIFKDKKEQETKVETIEEKKEVKKNNKKKKNHK